MFLHRIRTYFQPFCNLPIGQFLPITKSQNGTRRFRQTASNRFRLLQLCLMLPISGSPHVKYPNAAVPHAGALTDSGTYYV